MKVVLVKDGNTFKPESGTLPAEMPERIAVEINTEIRSDKRIAVSVWPPSIFPKGIGRKMEEYLKEKEKEDARKGDASSV